MDLKRGEGAGGWRGGGQGHGGWWRGLRHEALLLLGPSVPIVWDIGAFSPNIITLLRGGPARRCEQSSLGLIRWQLEGSADMS